jgi:hypothetical protein
MHLRVDYRCEGPKSLLFRFVARVPYPSKTVFANPPVKPLEAVPTEHKEAEYSLSNEGSIGTPTRCQSRLVLQSLNASL